MGSTMKLPNILRPSGLTHRQFQPGVDLPSWFSDTLKQIDEKLYLVWHPYKVIWDDMMNQYEGELEDPRFTIHQEHGEEVWGFVTTDGDGAPQPDNKWHVWRLCEPYGWAHVVGVEAKQGEYLRLLTNRLHLQATYREDYGDLAWNRKLDSDNEEARELAMKKQSDMQMAVQDENSWLMKKAMENMERGIIAPTNPTKDSIISFPGQKNKSKTIRPLDDEDAGLITLASR